MMPLPCTSSMYVRYRPDPILEFGFATTKYCNLPTRETLPHWVLELVRLGLNLHSSLSPTLSLHQYRPAGSSPCLTCLKRIAPYSCTPCTNFHSSLSPNSFLHPHRPLDSHKNRYSSKSYSPSLKFQILRKYVNPSFPRRYRTDGQLGRDLPTFP